MIFKIFQKPIETDGKFRSRCKGYENELTSLDYSIHLSGQDSFENCWRIETDDNGRLIPDKSELLDYLVNEMVLMKSEHPGSSIIPTTGVNPSKIAQLSLASSYNGYGFDMMLTRCNDTDIEYIINNLPFSSSNRFYAVCSSNLMYRIYNNLKGFNLTPGMVNNTVTKWMMPLTIYSVANTKVEIDFITVPFMQNDQIWIFEDVECSNMVAMIYNIG
jgi:hypothetical protein